MNELALFAGAGGGILGGHLLGWKCVCAVEWEPYPAGVLIARQNEGFLPPFPIWDDVRTFDGKPWRGIVDVVSGGFPCQDISAAGKGAGIDGERSGMWKEMARIIGEVRPRYVLVENSPRITIRGLGRVLGDLSELGYDAEWGTFGAWDVGAKHFRDRFFLLGLTPDAVRPGEGRDAHARINPVALEMGERVAKERDEGSRRYWPPEPGVERVRDGVPGRVVRLRAVGNAQFPAVVRLAWNTLYERIELVQSVF